MVTEENKMTFINNLKSIEMKKLLIILTAIGLLSLNSCYQKTDSNTMLENIETRAEIFNAITSNHDYMTEFVSNMQGNNHAMQMMQGNKKMMGNMMKGQGMQMMMEDSTMMNQMMGNKQMMHSMMQGMMKDGKMMGNMMKMMNEKGMMSEDCMQSCMKMMGDKGMDMSKMSMMNKTEGTTEEDPTEHH